MNVRKMQTCHGNVVEMTANEGERRNVDERKNADDHKSEREVQTCCGSAVAMATSVQKGRKLGQRAKFTLSGMKARSRLLRRHGMTKGHLADIFRTRAGDAGTLTSAHFITTARA